MTTIVGLKTNFGEEAVVLAADTQVSISVADNETYNCKDKMCKLHLGKNYALSFTGLFDEPVEFFLEYLSGEQDYDCFCNHVLTKRSFFLDLVTIPSADLRTRLKNILQEKVVPSSLEKVIKTYLTEEGKRKTELDLFLTSYLTEMKDAPMDPVLRAVKRGYFHEFMMLNSYQSKCNKGDLVNCGELMLAVNKPKLELYQVDAFGNLVECSYHSRVRISAIGSGADPIAEYFQKKRYKQDLVLKAKKVNLYKLDLPAAIILVAKLMQTAAQDLFTGETLDLAVVRRKQIDVYEQNFNELQDEIYRRVANQYKGVK